jgi:Rieske Fe-S protein
VPIAAGLGCSRREALLAASSVTVGALLSDCGAPDELGNGVCMATQSIGVVVASGAETLAAGSALRVMGAVKPIYVVRDERGFMALNATCTHQSCEAIYVGSRSAYECGCHGSRYGIDGTVLMGPAQKPLAHVFICRNSDGMLVVQPDHTLSSNDGRIA